MKNDIIDLLNIKDDDIFVTEVICLNSDKFIWLEHKLVDTFCPKCDYRMHSKGVTIRTVKHPILQDGFNLILKVKQRRWKCTNPLCKNEENESFPFVSKNRQTTNLIPYQIVNTLRDLNLTTKQVADRYNCSDNTVRNYLLQYVNIERLKLPRHLCVDEVFLNFDNDHKYALVLLNFDTKEVVDIVNSRRDTDTRPYFLNIPLEERNTVEYLICDMYNPYVNFTKSFFRKSECIVDSFHVISWIINKINLYIISVRKRYIEKDKARLSDKNYNYNLNNKTISESSEVYFLFKYKWAILKNDDNINYSIDRFYEKKLCRYMDTYQIIDYYLSLDNNFKEIRALKELYITFNTRNAGNEILAKGELVELIEIYRKSPITIFNEFAELLSRYFKEIVSSFKVVSSTDDYGNTTIRRLSNGPIESFNRMPKDYKRNSRGVSNFRYTRLRILLATRHNVSFLGKPKTLKEIKNIK